MTNFFDFSTLPQELKFYIIKDNFLSFNRVVNFKEINTLALVCKENLQTIETLAKDILNLYEAANLIKDYSLEINPCFPNRVNLAQVHNQFVKKVIEETKSRDNQDSEVTVLFSRILQNTPYLSPAHVLKIHEVLKERQYEGSRELFVLWGILTLGWYKPNFRWLDVPNAHLFNREDIAIWLKDPKNREQIARVKTLDLSSLQLEKLPSEIQYLTALKELNLAKNCLTHLPEEIKQLVSLEKLYLGDNHLKEFPRVITHFKSLKKLELQHNYLKELPPGIRLLKQLTNLNLSYNFLTSLPLEIGELNRLKVLSVNASQLTALPDTVGQLAPLTHLNISGNPLLRQLPISIAQLQNLTHLNLSANRLETLSESIGQLRSLTHLDLHFNSFEQFPQELIDSPVLKNGIIDFRYNPCKDLPVEVAPYLDSILYSAEIPFKTTLFYYFSLMRGAFH